MKIHEIRQGDSAQIRCRNAARIIPAFRRGTDEARASSVGKCGWSRRTFMRAAGQGRWRQGRQIARRGAPIRSAILNMNPRAIKPAPMGRVVKRLLVEGAPTSARNCTSACRRPGLAARYHDGDSEAVMEIEEVAQPAPEKIQRLPSIGRGRGDRVRSRRHSRKIGVGRRRRSRQARAFCSACTAPSWNCEPPWPKSIR